MLPNIPAEAFRTPLSVVKIKIFKNNLCFPVCPRCEITIEREYMHYCDRCGQCLDWKNFKNAIITKA